jgi:NAD(P)-dependent dehydrogenase (short-subunit alcohol dehydrogenase family)
MSPPDCAASRLASMIVGSFGEHAARPRRAAREVAPAYVFFASQESSYVTGEVLAVTGGQPM